MRLPPCAWDPDWWRRPARRPESRAIADHVARAQMCELVGEPGPTIDLGEQIRNVDVGQEAVELPFKRLGSVGNLAFQRRYDQCAAHEPHALKLSGASAIGELLELKIQRPSHRVEPCPAHRPARQGSSDRCPSFL